jgi:hypothetical protein
MHVAHPQVERENREPLIFCLTSTFPLEYLNMPDPTTPDPTNEYKGNAQWRLTAEAAARVEKGHREMVQHDLAIQHKLMEINEKNKSTNEETSNETRPEPPESERSKWYLTPEQRDRVAAGHREMIAAQAVNLPPINCTDGEAKAKNGDPTPTP